MADRATHGHVAVLSTRVEALRQAITDRDWEQVEFQHDRVSRSLSKLERHLGPAPEAVSQESNRVQAPAGYSPRPEELRDMEEAHAQGLHDEIPRQFCPECESQGRRA